MPEALENLHTLPLREVYSVSELNNEARGLLEANFPLLWIEGEVSNLAKPSSGHLYFSLKDELAQVRCAMFRQRNMHLGFKPANGMQVLLRARVSLYEGRGEFQLIAEHMEEAGDGALRRAFEALKQRLSSEGLFDSTRKQPLPVLPRKIGVVTSPTGAALRDILSVLRRRFPAIPVLIYPTPVQGAGAAQKIAAAINLADQQADCAVLIVARGGGSLEDLWSFNEEVVARAIHACRLPVVTGIGHEIDFTIADFVADRRAATPTAAAELVTPDAADWLERCTRLQNRLLFSFHNTLNQRRQTVTWLEKRLQHPGQRLRRQAQRLDELEQRLIQARHSLHRHRRAHLAELLARLHAHTPIHQLRQSGLARANLTQRLRAAFTCRLGETRCRLEALAGTLNAVSPLATLGRGYAIIRRLPDMAVVRSAQGVAQGDALLAQLGVGSVLCRVEQLPTVVAADETKTSPL